MSIQVVVGGYVQEKPAPVTKTSAGGRTYHVFQVSTKVGKDRDTGKGVYSYLTVKDFGGGELPKAKDFVEVTGSLQPSLNTKGDKTYLNLDVMADKVVANPPRRDGGNTGRQDGSAPERAPEKDPWE